MSQQPKIASFFTKLTPKKVDAPAPAKSSKDDESVSGSDDDIVEINSKGTNGKGGGGGGAIKITKSKPKIESSSDEDVNGKDDHDEDVEEEEEEVKPRSKIYKRKKAIISDDEDDEKMDVDKDEEDDEKVVKNRKKLPVKNGKPKTNGKKIESSEGEEEEVEKVSKKKKSASPKASQAKNKVKNESAVGDEAVEDEDKEEEEEETVEDKEDEIVGDEDEIVEEKKEDKSAGKKEGKAKKKEKAEKKTAEAKTPKQKPKESKPKSSTKKPAQKRGSKSKKDDDKSTMPKSAFSSDEEEKDQPVKKRTKSDEKVTEVKKKSPIPLKPPMPLLSTPTTTMSIAASAKAGKTEYLVTKSSNEYDPIEHAIWKKGQKVPYLALAKTLEAIEDTSSRLRIIEILSNFFRSVILLSPNELLFSLYLCLNKLAPAYEGIELGIAETNIMKAIGQATGRSMDSIKTAMGEKGDLGLVAEASRSNQSRLFQPAALTVDSVFKKLKEIASITGNTSQQKKIDLIVSFLAASKQCEARYIVRSLAGKLRIGLAEQSVLQALATANYLTPMNQDMDKKWPPKTINAGKGVNKDTLKKQIDDEALILKSSYCECPNYDILIKALIDRGIKGLSKICKLTPGIPPRPMLAQPTKGVQEVLRRFENMKFTCEYKYDGERAQIHLLEDGSIRIYSRNQENNTTKYPDIISRFKKTIQGDVKSCIIDSEAVAWDPEKKMILPFQVLSTRKRKDANEAEIKVHVVLYAFDLIYLNGESLVKKTFMERRQLLKDNFKEVEGEMVFAKNLDTDSMEEVQEFLEESIKGNCEGLMVKTLDVNASYELSKRSHKWLKLKKDYLDSGGDSLDLVVIGGFLGKGKRTGTYGGFLLACYEPENEEFQTICKIGTGFSDEQLAQHTETLKPHIIKNPKPYYRSHSNLTPDHWFDAVQVWEVKCADLSLSPIHTAGAGIVDAVKGISLRFPRFLRIRDDKNAEDATSASQVAQMYKGQEQVKNVSASKPKLEDDDEDFY